MYCDSTPNFVATLSFVYLGTMASGIDASHVKDENPQALWPKSGAKGYSIHAPFVPVCLMLGAHLPTNADETV